ncbi:anthranilate phosphoribosyltransferase [Thermobaculum terrenum ATCC BAA-798]|uniref:Anthranilate phosphoribosyltransferase n=1 Tax=Thermobaculum terrenum (strain ATCC BAA-798 / CCMEE 7001 / YNP1) TaxID=525904 RepID=D1CBJ6_THET1|nr:anthranilate phosphoribosyltransferase [Thermobaculum terrenum]ACZ42161.1 anthranilate phosphoribosyltransferase [Thermobaculum terrenum ATCC BAA-798]
MERDVSVIYEAIHLLSQGKSLTRDQAEAVMDLIMEGQVTGAQFGAIMMGLHLKGETIDEIAGFASVMRRKALRVNVKGDVVDTCGTGGDKADTFNISTTAAFVIAAAGAKVAKHGNRAMSSRCGSADVLEALGARIDLGPTAVERVIEDTGMGFMFAPLFHPAMKYAAGPRREMRVRTIFNILGPLTNPAGARRQVLGVADSALASKMIEALRELGSVHALVVHGEDGLDEITLSGPSMVYELKDGKISRYEICPEQFGFRSSSTQSLRGGDRETNADITRKVLTGTSGPARDVVLINAAAGLVAADVAENLKEGLEIAARVIDEGAAMEKLDAFIGATHRFAEEN